MKNLKRECLERFTIAGFSYYEGCIAFKNLKIGTKLTLKAEPTNPYDKNAIEIYYKKYKLGYVPREINRIISKLLLCGINVFEARIQRISQEEHTEEQIGVILYIISENNNSNQ